MTLEEAINALSLQQLRNVKELADQGKFDTALRILEEVGFNGDDGPPATIGQKVKRLTH